MEVEPAALDEMFSQLGSIAAVLGAFAFASAGALLAASEEQAGTAASVAAGAAVLVLPFYRLPASFSAPSWMLSTVWIAGDFSIGSAAPDVPLLLHAIMSFVFQLGILALFVSLGASGWVRSRRLGWFTSIVAFVATVAAMRVVFQFVE
ncbi:hypothetical protein [Rubrivirga sp.]|uniref:hypothetical protein n=1 Tax=Rubrivirga sp. TaxID=1885344 RepID=UPI003B51D926